MLRKKEGTRYDVTECAYSYGKEGSSTINIAHYKLTGSTAYGLVIPSAGQLLGGDKRDSSAKEGEKEERKKGRRLGAAAAAAAPACLPVAHSSSSERRNYQA